MLRRRLCHTLGLSLLTPAALACEPLRTSLLPYPGLYERGADGVERGFDVDVVRELGQRVGCEMRIEPTNTARTWALLSSGEVQISSGIGYAPERRAEVDFLLLARVRGAVVMRSAQAEATPTRAAFNASPSLLLGVTRRARRGAATQTWVDKLQAEGRIREGTDAPELLRLLGAGRVHAVLLFPHVLAGQPATWTAQHRVLDWMEGDTYQFGLAASRRGVPEALRERLAAAAESARRDGTLQRLAERHFGNELARWGEFVPVPR